MALEIERKFLLARPISDWGIDLLAQSSSEITQGYVTRPEESTEVRVRRVLEEYEEVIDPELGSYMTVVMLQWLAVKRDIPLVREEGGMSRHELELALSAEEFDQTWRLVEHRVLRKPRTSVSVRDAAGPWEIVVDEFKESLEGLVLAEVQFPSWQESVAFRPPDFLGAEVTHDLRYRNANLAAAQTPPYL